MIRYHFSYNHNKHNEKIHTFQKIVLLVWRRTITITNDAPHRISHSPLSYNTLIKKILSHQKSIIFLKFKCIYQLSRLFRFAVSEAPGWLAEGWLEWMAGGSLDDCSALTAKWGPSQETWSLQQLLKETKKPFCLNEMVGSVL